MLNRFGVIALCLSGVYCISSLMENLDPDELKRILNGETEPDEWQVVMDQHIIYKEADGSKSTVNVTEAVYAFLSEPDDSPTTEFERIHDIVRVAYQCTLRKYAGLTAFLMLRDLSVLKLNITTALRRMAEHATDFDPQTVFEDQRFQGLLSRLNREKYHLDYDFKLAGSKFQLLTSHDFVLKTSKQIHNVWADMVEKTYGWKIDYNVYPQVIASKFTNEYDQPIVGTINETVCVLNEAIQMLDKSVSDKCVAHDGSFEKNFESLRTGLSGDFTWLIRQFDKMKAVGTNVGLYRDYTKSVPGTLPSIAAIQAPGCFVTNLKFKISGFKTYLANNKVPTEIYGDNLEKSTSKTKLKLIKTVKNQPQDAVKVGLMMFRDTENWSDFEPQFITPTDRDTQDWCMIS